MSTIRPPHFNIIIIYENEGIINHKRLKIIKFIQKYIQKHSFLFEKNFLEFHYLFSMKISFLVQQKNPHVKMTGGGFYFISLEVKVVLDLQAYL
ncbi:hypothetical protein CMV16_00070 [Peribacillus simplex]|nr:hypothetical protein CMV16_00070 [Peribacillus simplex]